MANTHADFEPVTSRYRDGYDAGFKKAQSEGQTKIDLLTASLAEIWSAAADHGPMTTHQELLNSFQLVRNISNSAIKSSK